jgi:hypothetical protein
LTCLLDTSRLTVQVCVMLTLQKDNLNKLMNKTKTDSSAWTTRNKENTIRLALWTAAWLVTTAIAAFGPKVLWDFSTVPTILGVLANVGVGFGMMGASKRHLQGQDELMQKIQLEAMAFAMGMGLVIGLSYELLEDIRLISFEPEISHLVILVCLTYMAAMVAGIRKYR